MKFSKRFRIVALVLCGGVVVASSACSVDSKTIAPSSASSSTTAVRSSPFAPTAAQKALIGVTDGTYKVTFDPKQDQVFSLGPNRLEIPAWAVCKLGTTSYGPEFWNASCTPQTTLVQLTITVKNAASDNPSVDFQPAMRFSPQKVVSLYFYVPNVSQQDATNWVITYCPNAGSGLTSLSSSNSGSGSTGTSGGCVNEALTDPDLQTFVDYDANMLFRRLKHFSRYQVDAGYVAGE